MNNVRVELAGDLKLLLENNFDILINDNFRMIINTLDENTLIKTTFEGVNIVNIEVIDDSLINGSDKKK